jgi:hypothetical protein
VASPLFTGNVIAVIWDFDQTLIPGYQQVPLFEHYGVDGKVFWDEVNKLEGYYLSQGLRVSPDTLYLNHILTYVKSRRFSGLNNDLLKSLGSKLKFYSGMPRFLRRAISTIEETSKYKDHGITVEHYIVSTGLRQVILGSAAARYVKDIWACEFIESPALPGYLEPRSDDGDGEPPEIRQVGYFLDNTTKTRAIWAFT